jgi:ribosomal protein S18 acetylase RimI-like enzyme
MKDILQDVSADSLASAIEQNLFSWISVFGAVWAMKSDDPGGVERSISPVGFPFFNSIMHTRLVPENVEPAIQRIKLDAETRQVPVLWWVGPSTRPADLGCQLENRGFAIDEDGRGMAVDLQNLNESLPVAEGLSIQRAQDHKSLRDWSLALGLGFEAPAAKMDDFIERWSNFMGQANPDIVQAYMARLNGQPVATSLLMLGAGIAGIYAVATIPEARRKGIGAQVTLYPMLQARSQGYRVGILQSSEMGHGVYQSIGFRDYCRITSYIYQPITS